ncbi:MAG: hypothetical protein NZM42_00550 [Gemmatales bacterium]|nr:hypothetical protein [Gemmatales bacterium]
MLQHALVFREAANCRVFLMEEIGSYNQSSDAQEEIEKASSPSKKAGAGKR